MWQPYNPTSSPPFFQPSQPRYARPFYTDGLVADRENPSLTASQLITDLHREALSSDPAEFPTLSRMAHARYAGLHLDSK